MSADKGFLARWSRRKHQRARAPQPVQSQPVAPSEDKAAPGVQPTPVPQEAQTQPGNPTPSIDLVQPGVLPSLLRPGMPVELARAALRQAWRSDPAIRDFIGLSENSFDFTAPELSGFGPLTVEQVQQLLAQIGGASQRVEVPSDYAPDSQPIQPLPPANPTAGGVPSAPVAAVERPSAPQHEKDSEEAGLRRPKRHGSAMPK